MKLIDNESCDWSGRDYYMDNNGVAHKNHLNYGNSYTLENGDLLDDIMALQNGMCLDELDENNE